MRRKSVTSPLRYGSFTVEKKGLLVTRAGRVCEQIPTVVSAASFQSCQRAETRGENVNTFCIEVRPLVMPVASRCLGSMEWGKPERNHYILMF
jgi:hypothetical protein